MAPDQLHVAEYEYKVISSFGFQLVALLVVDEPISTPVALA